MRSRDKQAHERYLRRVQAVMSGDPSARNEVVREVIGEVRRRTLEEKEASEKSALPFAIRELLRAKLALLRDLELTGKPKDEQDKRWSMSLPLALWWGRLADRFQPELRGQLPGLCAGFTPAAGYLYTWLAPVGVAAIVVASISFLSDPQKAAAAKSDIKSAQAVVARYEGAASQASASKADSAGDATVRRVSAAVGLPNQTGDRGNSKVVAELAKEPRKITIRDKREVRVGDLVAWRHEQTTNFYCNSEWRQIVCDVYDQVPVPVQLPLSEE